MAILIGHRGARALAPENTLQGIRKAAECGATAVEVDVRVTLDGVLVLMHDENTLRTTGIDRKVSDTTFEKIREIVISGEPVPSLAQAVETARSLGLRLIVEMKEEGLEELVINDLSNIDSIVTSFYHQSLVEIKSLSDLRTGMIISSLPLNPVEMALEIKADAIFPRLVNPRLFKAAHQKDIQVFPWTINRTDNASWLLKLGADGLVTDDPSLLKSIVEAPIKDTSRENCDYYPCHFPGQDCTHCFCPLYPCHDLELGKFVRTRRGKRVWTCIDCRLVHEPIVARYLLEHPGANTNELKSVMQEHNNREKLPD